jgi:hypothetical protein
MFSRTVRYDFQSFVHGDLIKKNKKIPMKVIQMSGCIYAVAIPKQTFASTTTSNAVFDDIFPVVMEIVDWIVVGVFIFSGLKWMQGDRSKALEMLLGGCIGYLIARHAIDLREFLKGIGK